MEMSTWKFDGEVSSTTNDVVRLQWENATFFSLEHNGKTYNCEVISNRMEEGLLTVKLNHRVFDIRKSGQAKTTQSTEAGSCVGIAVSVGTEVSVGEPLLTLEAMKMENVLKAEGVGVVKSISIEVNQVVDKGSLLIEFE